MVEAQMSSDLKIVGRGNGTSR